MAAYSLLHDSFRRQETTKWVIDLQVGIRMNIIFCLIRLDAWLINYYI
jgi:hypothetical protein